MLGEILRQGHEVNRVRSIVRRLAPPYLDQSKLRVYVIDNKEWNALAMGNGAIWIFRGIMDEMSDNELAIVVGHELAHYTHEHSRRQMRRGLGVQIASLAAILAASAIDSNAIRLATQLGASLGFTAYINGYGRDLEDQADRVGLRYAHEGGFDVSGAPRRLAALPGEVRRGRSRHDVLLLRSLAGQLRAARISKPSSPTTTPPGSRRRWLSSHKWRSIGATSACASIACCSAT